MKTTWRTPPRALGLGSGEIHVWRCDLDRGADRITRLRSTLTASERRRAGRFRVKRDRDRRVAARGLLRSLLSRYLGVEASRVALRRGPFGKPALASAGRGLKFNVSHCGRVALFAFARGARVGIDVEAVRSDGTHQAVAERFFARAERAALRRLVPRRRAAAFCSLWTCKEAYLKAVGRGLSFPLERVEISFDSKEEAARLSDPARRGEGRRWSLLRLDAGRGLRAALAVEGPARRLERWRA